MKIQLVSGTSSSYDKLQTKNCLPVFPPTLLSNLSAELQLKKVLITKGLDTAITRSNRTAACEAEQGSHTKRLQGCWNKVGFVSHLLIVHTKIKKALQNTQAGRQTAELIKNF